MIIRSIVLNDVFWFLAFYVIKTNEVSISAKKIGADLALNVEAIWSTAEKFSMMVGVSSKVTSYASFKYLVSRINRSVIYLHGVPSFIEI